MSSSRYITMQGPSVTFYSPESHLQQSQRLTLYISFAFLAVLTSPKIQMSVDRSATQDSLPEAPTQGPDNQKVDPIPKGECRRFLRSHI